MKPVPLAMLALLPALAHAAPVPDWSKARLVPIEMSNLHFTPDRIVLRPGVAYRLRVHNAAPRRHDLTSEAFFANADIAPGDGGLVRGGKLSLRGGETRTIRLVPRQRGIYKFHSSQFGDAPLGMTGRFLVR